MTRLSNLGTAYREHALAEPAYYRVMFEQAVAETAFEASTAAVTACIDSGAFRPGDAQEMAKILWAASHGAVSLEIAGHFPPDTAAHRYETLMTAVAQAFSARPATATADSASPTEEGQTS
ncbi:TetR-like C-terminal domain-containing protein [Streptomyces sp. NEAU-S7GS2]|uniref:TetR-like C-terminal domain-containing protein n=1 Tax=Streptomyces sp. NEAU-S7GS2 TaxID=2202000 RepID=UPI001EF61BC2|nr:TetR-like C-terminal domain-containing protein [Streptomyces sp. NEAU-S7GS2]